MQASIIIYSLALAASVVNGQNEGCGLAVLDKCYRGFPLNGSTPDILVETVGEIPSVEECQWFCKELYSGECTWFAFDTKTSQCNIFKGSITDYTRSCELVGYTKEPNVADCSTTFTGDDACYNFREGYCRFEDYVILENLQFVQLLEHCQEACRHRPDCKFFLYEEKDKVCHLEGSQTRNCDVVHGMPDPPFGDCLSANKIPFTVHATATTTAATTATTVGYTHTITGGCCYQSGQYISEHQLCHCTASVSYCKYNCDFDEACKGYVDRNNGKCDMATSNSSCPNSCHRANVGRVGALVPDPNCEQGGGYGGCFIKN